MDIRVDGQWPIRLEVALGVQPGLPIADWIWTDITGFCFTGSQPAPIQITYGRQDEMSETQPAAMTTTLDNQDGRFTPGNMTSPLWPWWKRGLPIRARLDGLNLAGLAVREVPGEADSWAETPDHLSFAITDLDVRIDITPPSWRPGHGVPEILASQWGITSDPPDQRAWFVAVADGVPSVRWSANGVAGVATLTATAAVPADTTRLALRVVLDVDNGAGGHTATFYTGPSVNGPWAQLGAPVTGAGVTSIFASVSPVEVGSGNQGQGLGNRGFTGLVHRFQLRAGIDGAVVADANFEAINPGTETFTDTAGKPWFVRGYARITDPAVRYSGQLAETVPTWPYGDVEDRTDGDGESQVSITAAGVLRRLGQGASPLRSTLYRGITGDELPHPVAYWPCEDGKAALSLVEAFNRPPLLFAGGTPELANAETPASAPIPTYKIGFAVGQIDPAPNTGYLRMQILTIWPDSLPQESLLMRLALSGGTLGRWEVWSNTVSNMIIRAFNHAGTMVFESGVIGFNILDESGIIWLDLTQNGPNITWGIHFRASPSGQEGGFASTLNGHTLGIARESTVGYSLDLNNLAIGHVVVYNVEPDADLLAAVRAYNNERATFRMDRLCAEEGIPFWTSPSWPLSERVGPQRINALVALLGEAAVADYGALTEALDVLGLYYRARADLYDQDPAVLLDASAGWGHIVNPFSPIDDDQAIRNDVEVSRVDGSSVRVMDNAHIAEHGRYDEQTTVNVARDAQLLDIAGWRLHLGTWPGMRYPEISPALDAHPELAATWLRIRPGDLIRIAGLPRQHPAGSVDLIVQGWTESISPDFWSATANTTPGGPWDVATLPPAGGIDDETPRADTAGCVTASAVVAGGLNIYAATTKGPLWTDNPAELPLPLQVDGEDVHVSLIGPGVSDSFTGRTVANGWGTSTNGVPWTVTGGAPADFSVDGGSGFIEHPTLNVSRWAIADLDMDQTDLNLTAEVRIAFAPTGASIVLGVTARWVNASNNILCRVVFNPGNTMSLELRRRDAGSETVIAAAAPAVIVPFERVGVRMLAAGPTLRARLWRPEIRDEPQTWTLTATDTAVRPGRLGVFTRINPGNTNTLPFSTEWRSVALDNPQRLTVPAPGFQRAHPIGRDVRLTRPAIVAW